MPKTWKALWRVYSPSRSPGRCGIGVRPFRWGRSTTPLQHGTLPDFLSGLSFIPRILSRGNSVGARLIGSLYSPSHLFVIGYLQDLMKVVVPPTSLLHPGREAAAGTRLLICQETPAYPPANLYICRSFHYPPPVERSYSSAAQTLKN